ncbi:HlyD family type I secretion periplasmic adaptor subunit [Desulfonatronum thioautotrophicum]|uniref:HlyD family type I secretion periplasmic adaptor subunit n=1 Tax=Desulfonatronum thioautotrophicum TaxID=617001 RepID=UPI0005EAF43F|nr:HlyD family type I secretion periplasmic adaptor subunit [Desulfonatronum thioautotrophicum]
MNRGAPANGPETLPDTSRHTKIGLFVVVVLFGGFLLWATLAPLDNASVAQGVVTVDTYRKAVQHLEGGIIAEIPVREGDHVEAGQVVLRLHEIQPMAELEIVRGQLASALARQGRLEAERGQSDNIAFPEALDRIQLDTRQRDEFKDVQVDLFQARKQEYHDQLRMLGQRKERLAETLKGLVERQRLLDTIMQSHRDELGRHESLLDQGHGDFMRILTTERNLAEAERDLSDARTNYAETRIQLEETRAELSHVRHRRQADVVQELQGTHDEVLALLERERILMDRLERAKARAPVSGRVVNLQVHTVGGVIGPGQTVMEILPREDVLVVDAQVNPADIDRVYKGMRARVRFSTLGKRATPELTGKVLLVSADVINSPSTGKPFFLARILVDEEEFSKLEGVEVVPGMPVEVMIVLGERSLISYLFRPLLDAMARSFTEK